MSTAEIINKRDIQKLLSVKVGKKYIWENRVWDQLSLINIYKKYFIHNPKYHDAIGFIPNRVYFSSSLTGNPEYTKNTRPLWKSVVSALRKNKYDVYAPFEKTDPHANTPDNLKAYEIAELDNIQVLKSEIAIVDGNMPAHGVGQEIQLALFIPTIVFSQARLSRLVKGTPGTLCLVYKDKDELIKLVNKVFKRISYTNAPFYMDFCEKKNHNMAVIFKGRKCLSCEFADYLHS